MAQQTARSKSSGGAVDLDSYLWPNTGTEPTDTTNAAYEPQKEPIAGWDNDINYGLTWDIGALNYEVGDLQDRVGTLESQVSTLQSDLDSLESSFGSHHHDNRYYRKGQIDDQFVDRSGDTMTGALTIDTTNGDGEAFGASGFVSEYWAAVQDGNGRVAHYWNVEPNTQNVLVENEGAAWLAMNGGSVEVDVYSGTAGDAGSPPSWTRVLDATEDGLGLPAGGELGADLNAGGNAITSIASAGLKPSGDSALSITDGSGNSNNNPMDINYNDRDLRFRSALTGDPTMELGLYGDVGIPTGRLLLEQHASTIRMGGNNTGPHTIEFGDDEGKGLNLLYRTSPNSLKVEYPDGTEIWRTDRDPASVDYSGTEFVVLPVRSGAPNNPPSGATWIEV